MNLLNAIANPLMKVILRSPLHGLLSGSITLITVTGRRTGKLYTTPVNYIRDGDILTAFSYRARTWWRNLRGATAVTVRVRGRDLTGTAEATTDNEEVGAGLLAYLKGMPHHARYYKVGLDAEGQPNPQDVTSAVEDKVLIRIRPF